MRARVPSEDEETLEYKRQEHSPGAVIFEEMVRKLSAQHARPGPTPAAVIMRMLPVQPMDPPFARPVPPPMQRPPTPNVFLKPPRTFDAHSPWPVETAPKLPVVTPAAHAKAAAVLAPDEAEIEIDVDFEAPTADMNTNVILRMRPGASKRRGLKTAAILFVLSIVIGYAVGQDPTTRAAVVVHAREASQAAQALVNR